MVLMIVMSIIRMIDDRRFSCASRITKYLTTALIALSEDNIIPSCEILRRTTTRDMSLPYLLHASRINAVPYKQDRSQVMKHPFWDSTVMIPRTIPLVNTGH